VKKRLNEDSVVNELRQGSAFFRRWEQPAVPPPPAQSSDSYGAPDRASVRPPGRRVITRHPFEFYQDQIDALREFSLQERLAGNKGNMSEMVREALDDFISRRRGQAG
jgi:hypothetical protein